MDIDQFNSYSLNDKAKFTWQHGLFLNSVIESDKRINLYYVENFFVSIDYNTCSNKISGIQAFNSSNPLEKFLHDIELTDIQ